MSVVVPDLWNASTPEVRDIILLDRVQKLEIKVAALEVEVEKIADNDKDAAKTKEDKDKDFAKRRQAWEKRLNYIQTSLLVVLPILVSFFVSQHGVVPAILQYGLIGVGVLVVLILAIRLISP